MRACLDCGRPCEGTRCPEHRRTNAARRKAEGLTGERGSTHESRKRRERVLERAAHRCFYCRSEGADIADHYYPLAKGGPDAEANLVAACKPCNQAKGDKMPAEFLESSWLANRCAEVANGRMGFAAELLVQWSRGSTAGSSAARIS